MSTLSRKQREIQEREALILSHARPILLQEGYQALSMDRLAGLLEYAKGTIYNHFPNKEEIVLALAVESMHLRLELFEAAAGLSTVPRERLVGIGAACELFGRDLPQHFAVEHWLRNSSVWEKSSPKRQELIRQCELRCMSVVAGIVHQAIVAGDVVLKAGLTVEELVFGFWSLTYGSQLIAATSPSLAAVGIRDAPRAIRYHCLMLLNGFQWQPMEDWEGHHERFERCAERLRSLFPDEFSSPLAAVGLSQLFEKS